MAEQKSSSKARELYMARSEIGRYKKSKGVAVSAMERAESELENAKKTVKYLSSLIEKSNSEANAQKQNLKMLKKGVERTGIVDSAYDNEYVKLLRELEKSKQELGKLKLDMGSVLEEKVKLEKEIETYNTRELSQLSVVETLKKEIEEVNEELVLVELAHIEAMKEMSAVEAQRENEQLLYLSKIQETKKKMSELTEEMERSREIEAKLAATSADVEALTNELNHIKNRKGPSLKVHGSNSSEELENFHQLKIVTEELEAARKELDTIHKVSLDCMGDMDITRNELNNILQEIAQLNRAEEKVELKVQALNSKLLRAKFKLDTASAAEEKASSILLNMSVSFETLKKETEAAKKEKVTFREETEKKKAEVSRFEAALNFAEEKLKDAIDNLEAVKSSESIALENLQKLIEKILIKRDAESQNTSSITISKFEYEYLTGRAIGAEEIADKKIVAAQAWIDALKASEKELSMHLEMAKRELSQISIEEEEEMSKTGMEEEFNEQTQEYRKDRRNSGQKYQRRSIKVNRISSQQARVSGSPLPRGTSFRVKKRRNVMPSLAKYFNR